ncbi:MAG TPA: ABC transporter permease [Candidatus Saccharimonadales bacterium]|nr:ABC transporter permease [Candidatus Saccharimonadales bacterium]
MSRVIFGHVKSGINTVRKTKLRSFWMMLGVVIGVASVITVVAIGNGIKQQISGQIHHMGKNLITVHPAQLQADSTKGSNGLSLLSGLTTSGPLTAKDISAVERVPGVAASAPLTITNGTVSGENGRYKDGFVIGTTPDLASLLNQSLEYGVFLTPNDEGTNAAVLGQHAADALFNTDVPLGRSFTFHGERFIVKGIFNQFDATPLSQQLDYNNAIFIPNDVSERLTKNTAPTYEILVRPNSEDQTEAVAANIRKALDKTHGGQSGFAVLTGNQNLTTSNSILSLLTKLIAGVAAISLLVSGIGIMNVMLVSVSERKHEIGIRKAVGATNRQILGQFMVESSVLSLWGGLIGVGLSYLINIVLRIFTDLKPSISWEIVVLATGISLLVGVVFGTIPALKAARKDPIEALRSE